MAGWEGERKGGVREMKREYGREREIDEQKKRQEGHNIIFYTGSDA